MYKIDKLINDIYNSEKRISELDLYIKENKRLKLKSFFNSYNYDRKRKNIYGNILEEEKELENNRLSELKDNFKTINTLDFNLFTNFLCDVISINEGETYIKINFKFSSDDHVCLITSYENMKKIKNFKDENVVKTSLDIMDLLCLQKYILIDKNKTYNIYDEESFKIKKELLICFPYLDNILKMIFDLKITNEYSEEEIFSIVKESILPIYKDDFKENVKTNKKVLQSFE